MKLVTVAAAARTGPVAANGHRKNDRNGDAAQYLIWMLSNGRNEIIQELHTFASLRIEAVS